MRSDCQIEKWIAEKALSIHLNNQEVFTDLPASITCSSVVGIALSVRSAHELVITTHMILRTLVEKYGFRAVAIEGTESPFGTAAKLDHYVTTGNGNPAQLLLKSQAFLHNHESLEIICWLRNWASMHPADPVRIVHDLHPSQEPGNLMEIELNLARRDLSWHEITGQRVIHWGGTAHLVAANKRKIGMAPQEYHRNAGGHLRKSLGSAYTVIALTVGEGYAPFRIPSPPHYFTEAVFEKSNTAIFFPLHGLSCIPDSVNKWIHKPLVTRSIGPNYDADQNENFRVETDNALINSVDAFVYVPLITPVNMLE